MKKRDKDHKKSKSNFFKKPGYGFLIAIITFFVFANTFKNGYNLDDNLVTQNHPLTSKGLSTVKEIFTRTYYQDESGNAFGYRPIVHLSFAFENALFGESPAVSHFFNVVLYVLAVFLFYKLLLLWLGEKNKTVALMAALFFALHPVHSEVVASIKNRDEILAFLFAMLSALQINKYLIKKKLGNLLLVGLFFTVGLLAKKSIFPLVIVFPIAQFLLTKNTSLKELFLICLLLLVPSALIIGENNLPRIFMVLIIPFFAIYTLIFGIKLLDSNELVSKLKTTLVKNQIGILSVVVLGVIIYNYFTFNFYLLVLAALLLGFIFIKNKLIGFLQISLFLFVITIKTLDFSVLDFVLFFGMYFLLLEKNEIHKKYIYLVLFLVFSITIYLAIQIGFSIEKPLLLFQKTIMILAVFLLLRYKKTIGLIFAFLFLIFAALFNWSTLFILFAFILLEAFLQGVKLFSNFKKYKVAISVLIFVMYNGFFALKFTNNIKNTKLVEVVNTQNKDFQTFESRLKEGRDLEYVENTLVFPHTTNELVGTGFEVLGEYARLMIFPNELSFYYGYSKIQTTPITNIFVGISILFYTLLIVLAVYQLKKRPIISIAVLWYVGCILLFSNWVEFVAGMVGERLAFTASAGFSILFAALFLWIKPALNLFKPQKIEFSIFIILFLFTLKTINRNKQWENPISLMSEDIKHLDKSAQANNMYAMSLLDESMRNAYLPQNVKIEYRNTGITHLKKAIEIYPYFFNYNFDLGRGYITLNDNSNAYAAFLKAYTILPDNILVLEELTKTSFDLGNVKQTEFFGNKYLEINSNNENIHELVAYIFLINKNYVKANFYAKRGLNYFPNNLNLNKMVTDSSLFL